MSEASDMVLAGSIDRLIDGLNLVGEQALQLSLLVVRIDAIVSIVASIITFCLLFWAKPAYNVANKVIKDIGVEYVELNEVLSLVVVVFALVFYIIAFITSVVTVLNAWTWIAAFNPKLALAHDMLTALMNKQ